MAAAEAHIPLECKHIDLFKGEHKAEEFLKINPDHTVPTLVDGEFRLWESRAIMTYLIDKYAPNNDLYPRDLVRRARIDRMLCYDLANVDRRVGEYIRPQLFEKKPADPEKCAELEKVLDYLENHLKDQKFIAAEHLTIADLSITAVLGMLELKDWSFDRWPKVNEWRIRIREHAWYAKANEAIEEYKIKIKSET
jgi:glutathione S-transferase